MRNTLLFSAILLVLVAGCTYNQKSLSQRQQIEIGCASVATAAQVITTAIKEGKLSDAQVRRIGVALDKTDLICDPEGGVYPNLSDVAMQEFKNYVNVLQEVK